MNSNEKKYVRRAGIYAACAILAVILGIYFLATRDFSSLRSAGVLLLIFLLLTFYYAYKFSRAGNYSFTGEYGNNSKDDDEEDGDEPFFAPEEEDDGSGREMYPDDIQK